MTSRRFRLDCDQELYWCVWPPHGYNLNRGAKQCPRDCEFAFWCDQSKVQQARELLAPVYGWFSEGFDPRDLKEANALLEELQTWG